MKKCRLIAVIAVLGVLVVSLFGCASSKRVEFSQPNLMDNATVMPLSGNVKNAKSAIDGKPSSSAKLVDPKRGNIDFDLGAVQEFNTMILRENTDTVDCFRIYTKVAEGDEWQMVYEQDRITDYRLCYLESQKARYIRIDLAEVRGIVKLGEVELYNMPKAAREDFRVTQYLVMMEKDEAGATTFDMKDVVGNEGFSGNYNIVTDIMLIGTMFLDKESNVSFGKFSEQEFADNLAILRTIIGARKVNVRVTVFINPYKENTQDAKFLKENMDKIAQNIKAFTTKYDLDGIDYDWEYPNTSAQWKIYGELIIKTAEFTKVSVALPTWGIGLNKAAKAAIEFVNLMTYDLFDKRGDHSNIYIGGIDGINKLIAEGFSKRQICLGIPTYARTIDGSNNAWPSLVNYPELGKWGNIVQDFEYKHEVKDETVDRINTAYFNGYAMTRDKTALALAYDIGGVMLFRARCDAPYTYEFSCHRAVEDVVKNYN